jgi:hypothetical protein
MDRECKRREGNRQIRFFVQHAMSNSYALPPRARHLAAIVPVLALAALISACNVGNATPNPTAPATNGPTGGPTNGPTVTPTTPEPTPEPTQTPEPTVDPNLIDHPTGANDIILRMEEGGGFVPFGFLVTQSPQFTLYGDGTVIFKPIDNRPNAFEQAYLPWQVTHLDENGIQALLQYALTTGRLANAKDTYDNPMIADAGTTTFVLNAAGQEKVVNIYALFEMPDPNVPDQADRAGFSQLRAALMDFQNQSGIGDITTYEPEFYRVIMMQGFGEPVADALDWPWDDLTPADFPAGDEPGGIAILDSEHVAELLEVPNGGHTGVWVTDPDGNIVQMGVRPLLPDENPEG